MNDNTKVLVALLAGVAAGAALGILFAPEKGTETRDKLNDALKNLGDSIKDRAAEEVEQLASYRDQVLDTIKNRFGAVEDELNAQKPAVADQV